MLRALRVLVYAAAFVAPPVLVSVFGVQAALADRYDPPPASARTTAGSARPVPPEHDPDKPTVVVLLSNRGLEITDALAPYEVFAESGAFNVYTAAPEPAPAILSGGLDVIPHLSLAELDRRLSGKDPEVVVVPAMWAVGSVEQRPVADWLRRHAAGVRTVMSVCDGAEVLADAGLLRGRRATANWANLAKWSRRYPGTDWVRGKRYVEDGNVLSAAGVTSGTSAALHVVGRYVGVRNAHRLAATIGYPDSRLGSEPSIRADSLTRSDRALYVLGGAYDWNRPRVGMVLTPGVSEIELASAFDTYPGPAFASRTTSLAAGGRRTPVTTEHGLRLVPRHDLADAPLLDLDRLMVPGRDAAAHLDPKLRSWAGRQGLPLEFVHAAPAGGFAFDATLADLARHENAPLARFTARLLEYPSGHLTLAGAGWPISLWVRPLALGLLGVGAVATLDRIGRRLIRRARGRTGPRWARSRSSTSSRSTV
ncbi:DJ-1/PfpI family protein [Actinopolymorpha cephalotaxi]|uniref:DJ-1/PfpI family protein n=1 Tax=Actinopolymorpha cephalotaxi TaxID=504797 RepID=A0A1I2X011_9ACTN|nr:DJ-1/PfpI family protein [Actinopolymorpha cephalotaxi]NYH85188.1 putative intracellular protease/amidase [Actinopolymorpha cephalotaxi]SFH06036.1 DJ-1/PfpI family protein [Actinopolymorpha cephalotaxi]